jgi:hypothetical protein
MANKESFEELVQHAIQVTRPPTRNARPHADLEVIKILVCPEARRCRVCEFVHTDKERCVSWS